MFQVGRLLNPKDDDLWFDTEDEAYNVAISLSMVNDDCVWAVWNDYGSLLALVYRNEGFVPTN